MGLIDTKILLEEAKIGGYAVPAVNVDQIDSIMAILRVSEELHAPVIIQLAPIQTDSKNTDYKTLIEIIKIIGKNYSVKFSVHLDHGVDVENVKLASKSGFSSVMYDGSKYDFETNKNNTAQLRQCCNTISLEGELGIVGGAEGKIGVESDTEIYTDVAQAVEYVRDTKVDFLAVAIGNAHGIYREEPKLNFERLAELSDALSIPLVLHGASGLSEEDIKKAVKLGICKINFFTDIDRCYMKGIREQIERNPDVYSYQALGEAGTYIDDQMKHIIEMCGCKGRG